MTSTRSTYPTRAFAAIQKDGARALYVLADHDELTATLHASPYRSDPKQDTLGNPEMFERVALREYGVIGTAVLRGVDVRLVDYNEVRSFAEVSSAYLAMREGEITEEQERFSANKVSF